MDLGSAEKCAKKMGSPPTNLEQSRGKLSHQDGKRPCNTQQVPLAKGQTASSTNLDKAMPQQNIGLLKLKYAETLIHKGNKAKLIINTKY
jgi:hypothetical protein